MTGKKDVADARATYVAPRVIKMEDLKQGAGDCTSGSGDSAYCANGNSTQNGDCHDGNNATNGFCTNGINPT